MVGEGTFRKDLYYRLNVIPITVPPLRERADDIPLLARHFVAGHAAKMGRANMEISPDAMDALGRFHWAGNVRELENILERAVALCIGQSIELGDLPPEISNFVVVPTQSLSDLPEGGVDLEELVSDLEMNLIRQALVRGRYSQKRAAELLGLTPRSFRYRLQKYRLETEV
jgi:DNA-binding NtrC family response regulator